MKKVILEIKNQTYSLQPINENSLSARRALRRALRMIIDEYKRNIKHPDVHKVLESAIAHLKQDIQAVEAIEDSPDTGGFNPEVQRRRRLAYTGVKRQPF